MGNVSSNVAKPFLDEYKNIDDKEPFKEWNYWQWYYYMRNEIDEERWKHEDYEELFKELTYKNNHIEVKDSFCKWLKTQKYIFDNIKKKNPEIAWHDWSVDVLPEIKIILKEKQNLISSCGNIDDINISVTNSNPKAITINTDTKDECDKKIGSDNINIPDRRRRLYLDGILSNIDIFEKSQASSRDIETKVDMFSAYIVGSLVSSTENYIRNMKQGKQKKNNNEICNIINRNFYDYRDILYDTDTSKDTKSMKFKCKFQKFLETLGNENDKETFKKELVEDLKKKIETKLKDLIDENNGKSCKIDSSYDKPQCVRFLDELFDDFFQVKEMIESRILYVCNNNFDKKINRNTCTHVCNGYKSWLAGKKARYGNLKKECIKKNDPKKNNIIAEIESTTRTLINNCSTCTLTNANIDLSQLFDENNHKTNLIYHCNCGNVKNRKDEAPCNDKSAISGILSLKGNWKTAAKEASSRGGARSSEGDDLKDACELDWHKHSVRGGGGGAYPCSVISINSSWKCDVNGMEKGFCFPPRRQNLCIWNIKNLGDDDINNMDSDKLLLELMLAAKEEGNKLWKRYGRDSSDRSDFCQSIRRGYFDFRDIIKGTDKWKQKYGNNDLETKLQHIFKEIQKKLNETIRNNNGYSDIDTLRNAWWNENSQDIWKAFICGTKQYIPKFTPGNITFGGGEKNKSLVCESKGLKNDSPPDENVPQFLRWFEEWAQNFCSQRKKQQKLINDACKKCNDDSCDNGFRSFIFNLMSSIGCNCKEQCQEYSNWMDIQKSQFNKQQSKYNQLKDTLEYIFFTDSGNKNAQQYLDEKISETKCKGNDNVKGLMFDSFKTFSSYPDGYEQKCSKCSPQLEVYLGKQNDGNDKKSCKITDGDIINGAIAASCDSEKNDKKEWNCNEKSKINTHSNVCVPNRTKDLCLGYINHQKFKEYIISNNGKGSVNEKFVKGVILEAKQEGENIWNHYVGKQNEDDTNKKKEACKIMKRNFADLGDIIKGTNIWNKNNQVDIELKEIFEKIWTQRPDEDKYTQFDDDLPALRNDWWEANKDAVWEAFVCDGRDKECVKHDDIDKIPQFLRWLNEWSEEYCDARKKQLGSMENECKTCEEKMKGKIDINICNNDNCKECKTKCEEYKDWKKNWKENWDTLKQYFNEQKNQNNSELYKYLKDQDSTNKEMNELIKNVFDDNNCTYEKTLQTNSDITDTPHEYNTACDCVEKIELAKKAAKNAEYSHEGHNKTEQHICKGTFEDGWIEWDCSKRDSDGYSVCMKRNPNIEEKDNKFDEWFNEWIGSFLGEYDQFKDENICIDNKIGNTNACLHETCRDKCYCYNKWAAIRKLEWELLQEFYKPYTSGSNKGLSQSDNIFNLDSYLSNSEFSGSLGLDDDNNNTTGTIEMQKRINEAIIESQKCADNCPKKLSCEEKGFLTEWECEKTNGRSDNDKICVKEGDENKYEKPNLSAVNKIDRFYDSFNEWLNDMEHMLEENIKLLEYSCNKKTTYTNKNRNICFRCENDCECYKNLKGKIKAQWENLKGYYKHYKSKPQSKMHNIELDTYLAAKCELDATEKGKDESEAEELCRKKNTHSGSDHTIFDEMLNKTTDKKKSICKVCDTNKSQDISVPTGCENINRISDNECREKEYDKKDWKCSETDGHLENNVCVPPRGQALCVANMATSDGKTLYLKNEESDLKSKLKEAIKKETKVLHKYYKKKTGTTNGELPPGFCHAVYRSFNDFKNIVTGEMLWKPTSIGAIDKQIKTILESSITGTKTTTQDWWQQNEKGFWNAAKCGIKESGIPSATGLECPRFISDDDQFEWWAKEWSDDYYSKHKALVETLDNACNTDKSGKSKDCENGTGKMNDGECQKKCTEYKDFLTKKRNEWNNNFKEYLNKKEKDQEKNSGVDQKEYSPEIFYLLNPCTYQSCDNKYITALLNNKTYGDKQKECTCDTTQKSDETNPCNSDFTHYGCTDKKYDLGLWSSTYVKNPKDRGKVYAPPRRNSMCIGWLFSPINKTDKENAKEELKNKIIYAAKGETHYLWDYYRKKNGSTTTTSPPPGYCDALKRSFADIGDMVRGTDLWNAEYSPLVEKNIHAVFELDNDGRNGKLVKTKDELLEERKSWWEKIREVVWKAMNCDKKNTCNGDSTPEDDKKPQFLRWLEEWGEYICEERQKHLEELKKMCKEGSVQSDKTCDKGSVNCKKQCSKYNNWINIYKREWLGQKLKYKEIYENKDKTGYKNYEQYINSHDDANMYIKEKCTKCQTIRKNGATNDVKLDTVFNKTDEEYKEYEPFCTTCRMKDIAKKAKENTRVNPCGDKNGTKPTTSVKQVAKTLQNTSKTQLQKNGGESELKGKVHEGKYKNNHNTDELKGDICSITDKHTNDSRNESHRTEGPCTGKNKGRFNIGEKWEKAETQVHKDHNDVLFPPRRRHMCTSNLENLDTTAEGLAGGSSGNDSKLVNNSFLGDVLLAAKFEGEFIKTNYKDTSDKDSMCRAMKYSFADLGDVIRGRDIWTREHGNKELQKHLEAIFAKIKENPEITGKYKTEGNPYTKLREYWWEANRDKVWKAMKCSGNTTCGSGTPHDDYIPQKLRWLTEWSEWYCKKQKVEYDKVKSACKDCKNGGPNVSCKNCPDCKAKCKAYSDFITKWKADWEEQKKQYKTLYENAKTSSSTGTVDENQKYLNEFLKRLQKANSTNTTYESAEGYVHQELKNMDCVEQIQFCKNNSGTQTISTEDTNYAFREQPHDHEKACKCDQDASAKTNDICKKDGTVKCDDVNNNKVITIPIDPDVTDPKKNKENNRDMNCGGIPSKEKDTKWKNTIYYHWVDSLDPNIYVSPRRQKLCYNDLEKSNSIDNLKERLLTAAANDAYNVAIKYNDYKNHYGVKPCKALEYSFNDYKHLIEGGELLEDDNSGTNTSIKNSVKDYNVSKDNPNNDKEKRKRWWKENKKCVWSAMICGYQKGREKSNDGTTIPQCNGDMPDDTKNIDQFLFWLQEWYEDYCNIRKNLKSEVQQNCKVTEETFDCKKCTKACNKYQEYMKKKKHEWDSQNQYYSDQKKRNGNKGYTSDSAKEYLKKKFPGSCDISSGNTPSGSVGDVETNIDLLDIQQNYDVDIHCSCKKYNDREVYKNIVGQSNCEGLKMTAEKARNKGKEPGIKWIHYGGASENNYLGLRGLTEHIYVPPRRQKLCFQGLDTLDVNSDEKKLRHHLMKLFIGEGKNLGEYYNEKEQKSNEQKKYDYDVEPCSAMKYSFLDLRDIILGHDMVEPHSTPTGVKLKKIFDNLTSNQSANGTKTADELRKTFWDNNKECFWKAMICGYKHSGQSIHTQCEKIPEEKDYPIGSNREEGTVYQFLRWFTEWGEDFCKHKEKEYKKLQEQCPPNTCIDDNTKKKCETACETYKTFIKQWKEQYDKQSKKYMNDKVKPPYKDITEVENSPHAYQYLDKKLKNITCTNGDCNCMETPSTQNTSSRNDMPKSLEETPVGYEQRCNCNVPTLPRKKHEVLPNVPQEEHQCKGLSVTNSGIPDGASFGGGLPQGKCITMKGGPTPRPEPSNCVQKIAYDLWKNGKKNIEYIEHLLNGYEMDFSGKCKKLSINKGSENSCNFNTRYHNINTVLDHTCKDKSMNRLKTGEEWRCPYIRELRSDICIPPRREGMCMLEFKNIFSSDINDSKTLLQIVQKIAKHEGDDIIRKSLQEYPCKEYLICDALKYSFADLADIIRGRDIVKNVDKERTERKLQSIFRNIYNKLPEIGKKKNKYLYDIHHRKLREHWWDANRETIWKAMTCALPNDAHFLKKDPDYYLESSSSKDIYSTNPKCGHNSEPPDYDYIPQPFRWMQEWSEYFCKACAKEIQNLEMSCKDCATIDSSCTNDADGTKCKTCKEKCASFGKFVKKWKEEFDKQSKTYNELYTKANSTNTTTNNNDFSISTQRARRITRILEDDNNKHINSFLKEVKEKCADKAKTADKYLHKTSHCTEYTFLQRKSSNIKYAFKGIPKTFETKCNCKISTHPMDKCPFNVNNNHCNDYDSVQRCTYKMYENELNYWNEKQIINNFGENTGVLLPPRRKHMCFRNITSNFSGILSMDDFKNELLKSSYAHGKMLGEKYKNYNTSAHNAMRYSFHDYGDVIKGTDMMEKTRQIKDVLETLLPNTQIHSHSSTTVTERKTVDLWWSQNRTRVWNAMLCGYKKGATNGKLDNKWCEVPSDDETPQFLRWLEEWAQLFCYEKVNEAKRVVNECIEKNKIQNTKKISEINDISCKQLLTKYREWYLNRKAQWDGLKKAYKNRLLNGTFSSSSKMKITQNNAEKYIISKCPQCDCTYQDLDEMYKKITNGNNEVSTLTNKAQIDSIVPKDTPFYKIFTIYGLRPKITKFAIDAAKDIISKGSQYGREAVNIGIPTGIGVVSILHEKIKEALNKNNTTNSHSKSPEPTTPGTQQDEPSVPINDILSSTLPLGISFALGSIALLFYMKKSSNKYVPYRSQYKGKTYIYVEGDEPDDYSYLRDISSSDLTSSSESEYEELDINDIYPYKSPKYKTLIEVVLKPSSKATYDNTSMYQNDNSNKLTDEEWNQLKQDFIINMLQSDNMDISLENLHGNTTNTQPNIVDSSMEEKPFITSIQDRYLHGDSEIIYNIDWNVPENISANTTDEPKYFSNDQYTGIDLINDSLNRDKHIDIYDELLKRKENELFGTKHKKNATTNSVVMEANSDPISNQIDLFHKWLDRHRDMCNQWNNKEDILNKLNVQWNNENKEHLLYKSNIDDINRINDENYNIINTNIHEGNDKTSLEHLGSTNIPPNDLITQNNGSQTKNLCTNVSMDIHFDENNNNVLTTDVTHEDNQLENSYNL